MLGICISKYFLIPLFFNLIIFSFILILFFTEFKNSSQKKNTKSNLFLKKIYFCFSIFFIGYLLYKLSFYNTFELNCFEFSFLKEKIREILYFNFPKGLERDLLSGLLLGERYIIDNNLLKIFQLTNTIHILAISGLHVGFIGIVLIGFLRSILIPRKIAAICAIIVIIIYVSIIGWRPPATRSAIIMVILLLGWILDRPIDIINSLSLAAIIILLINPNTLFDLGFQLSFIIVFSLIVIAPKILTIRTYILKALGSSFIAWLSSLPLVAYYFGVISPISVIANIFIVPLVGIIISIGFCSIMLGIIFLPFSGIFNCLNYYLLKLVILFVNFLGNLPGAYFFVKKFPLILIFIYYLLFLILLLQNNRNYVKISKINSKMG